MTDEQKALMNASSVAKWLQDGCPSFGIPEGRIKALLEVATYMATFDGRNNNAALKEMAQKALR